MKTLKPDLILALTFTVVVISDLLKDQSTKRIIHSKCDDAADAFNIGQYELAQKTVLAANLLLRETLAIEGTTSEQVVSFLRNEGKIPLLAAFLAAGISPAECLAEIAELARTEEKTSPTESFFFTQRDVG